MTVYIILIYVLLLSYILDWEKQICFCFERDGILNVMFVFLVSSYNAKMCFGSTVTVVFIHFTGFVVFALWILFTIMYERMWIQFARWKKVLWKYFPKIITDMAQQGMYGCWCLWCMIVQRVQLITGEIIETVIVPCPLHLPECSELFSTNLLYASFKHVYVYPYKFVRQK